MNPVIAIDGPSGAGKGTVCALIAQELGWHLLDSGALYRITGLAATRRNIALDDEDNVAKVAANLDVEFKPSAKGVSVILEGDDVSTTIRTEEVGSLRSEERRVGKEWRSGWTKYH